MKWLFRVGEVIGRWRIVRPLGHGRTGQVYLVAAPGQTAAVKVYCNLTPDESEDARQRELRVYRHPDLAAVVPRLLESGTTEHGNHPYLVLEPVETFTPSRRMSVRAIRQLFKALADAIDAFHRAGFILCDFKIGNFGFVGKRLVIFDFDATCTVAESLFVRSVTFTQWYVATEVWRDGILTSAADVFSLGHALQVVSNLARTGAFNDLIAVATAPDRADRLPDMATFKAVLKGCKPVRNAVKTAARTLLALGALASLAIGLANASFNERQAGDNSEMLTLRKAEASFEAGRKCFLDKNYPMAVIHLERALSIKDYDNAEAHGMLALCYYKGWGVKQNLAKARKYAAHAAKLGDELGKAVLKALSAHSSIETDFHSGKSASG